MSAGGRALGRLALACGLAALASCEATPGPATPQLYTTADLQRLLATGETTIAPDAGVPGGLPLSLMIAAGANQDTLVPRLTFTGLDAYRSAYVTTEVWTHFDEVWIQPMYVLVDGYASDGTPERHQFGPAGAAAWRPIFGVGDQSKFYSPYWQEVYFELPAGADPDSFRSVRDVVDRGVSLTPANGRVVVLAPDTVSPPTPVGGMANGPIAIGGPTRGTGLLDGAPASFLDFGEGTFTWNDDLVVQEVPLFVWVARDAEGQLQRLDIPTIGGSGPLDSNTTVKMAGDRPLYGSYWRIYTVEVPAGMGVFAPPVAGDEGLRAGLGTLGDLSMDGKYGANVLSAPSSALIAWEGRVATNPDCFSDVANIDEQAGSCVYLDSQTKIEAIAPNDTIHKTDILVTCPFVTYDEIALTLP
ncbi:MAG TPA: hypothetical protein VLA14_05205 [Polyangia bacterium]|nr:hypothetical protein [Polyangia bacterium]